MTKENNKPNKWRNDIILAGVILTLAAVFLAVFTLTAKEGQYAKILVDGEVKYTLSLDENTEKIVSTKYGENKIVIKDGNVSVASADCPDKICVGHREISKTGETIVCLPHKLVVEIGEKG